MPALSTQLLRVLALLLGLIFSTPDSAPAAVRFWDGGGANGFWNTSQNWSNNVIPSAGDSIVFPEQPYRLSNTNRFLGGITNLASLRWTGKGYTSFSVPVSLSQGITHSPLVNGANVLKSDLTLKSNQTWSVAAKTRLTLEGDITVDPAVQTWIADIATGGTLNLNGILKAKSGSRLVKRNNGTLDLGSSNHILGPISVGDGTLQFNGALEATSLVVSNGASLQGSGSVPAFTCAGDIRPGGAGLETGTLHIHGPGSAVFLTGSRLFFDLKGTQPGIDYDTIRCDVPPDLSNAQLFILPSPSFRFQSGQSFVIVSNTSAAPQTKRFANLPQDAQITVNSMVFSISYLAGSGNDVALTVVSAPYQPSGKTRTWAASPQPNALWSSPNNWSQSIPPDFGDHLFFPNNISQRNSTPDLPASSVFDLLQFQGPGAGWNITGSSLRVAAGILASANSPSGSVAFNLPSFEVFQSQSWKVTNMSLEMNANMFFAGNTLTLQSKVDNTVTFHRELIGPGTLELASGRAALAPNSGTSNLQVRILNGQFAIQSSESRNGPPWDLVDGELLLRGGTIPGIRALGGQVSAGDRQPTIILGPLSLASSVTLDATFQADTEALLTTHSSITLQNPPLNLHLQDLQLLNTTLTLVRNKAGLPVQGQFQDLPEGATLPVSAGISGLQLTAVISYLGGDGSDITLRFLPPTPTGQSKQWSGSNPSLFWSNADNWQGNLAPISGDQIVFPTNSNQFASTNDLSSLVVDSILLEGAGYHLAGNLQIAHGINMTSTTGVNEWLPGQILLAIGSQTWNITHPNATLRLSGNAFTTTTASAPIPAAPAPINKASTLVATGPITQSGAGTLELNSIQLQSPDPITVDGGQLVLRDTQINSHPGFILKKGSVQMQNVIGFDWTAEEGTVELLPSNPNKPPQSSFEGNGTVTLNAATRLKVHMPSPNTPALRVSHLTLNNPNLELVIPDPGLGIPFEIILALYPDDGRTGQFKGLAENDTLTVAGRIYAIHYDVSIPTFGAGLKAVFLDQVGTIPPSISSLQFNELSQTLLSGTGPVRYRILIESSTDLLQWLPLATTQTEDSTSLFQFIDPRPLTSRQFYRAVIP